MSQTQQSGEGFEWFLREADKTRLVRFLRFLVALFWFLLGLTLGRGLCWEGIFPPRPSRACAHCQRPACPAVSRQVARTHKPICVLRAEPKR